MLALYYYPNNASLAPHLLLRELDVPFELRLVDRTKTAQRDPEYLELNPNGRIPVLVDGDLVLWESAAICLHLFDTHRARFAERGIVSGNRAHLYKWMFWLSATLQPELFANAYPERWSTTATEEVLANVRGRIEGLLDLAETALDPYLLGSELTIADHYFLMLAYWTRKLSRPAHRRPKTARLIAELMRRKAVQATFEHEGLAWPA